MNNNICKFPKLRKHSRWLALSKPQRKTISGWLYRENLSLREVRRRMQDQFGFTCCISTIANISHHFDDLQGWITNSRLQGEFKQPPLSREALIKLHLESRAAIIALFDEPSAPAHDDFQI